MRQVEQKKEMITTYVEPGFAKYIKQVAADRKTSIASVTLELMKKGWEAQRNGSN